MRIGWERRRGADVPYGRPAKNPVRAEALAEARRAYAAQLATCLKWGRGGTEASRSALEDTNQGRREIRGRMVHALRLRHQCGQRRRRFACATSAIIETADISDLRFSNWPRARRKTDCSRRGQHISRSHTQFQDHTHVAYVREPLPIMSRDAASNSLWRGPTAVALQVLRRHCPEPARHSHANTSQVAKVSGLAVSPQAMRPP
jgi:hypothetical protein